MFKFRVPQLHSCTSALKPAFPWDSTWGLGPSASPSSASFAFYFLCTCEANVSPLSQLPPGAGPLQSALHDRTDPQDARPAQGSAALGLRSANSLGDHFNRSPDRVSSLLEATRVPPCFPTACGHISSGWTLAHYSREMLPAEIR